MRDRKTASVLAQYMPREYIPQDALHEPYIVAMLIAMAQQQRRAMRQTSEHDDGEKWMQPKVLFTSNDRDFLHLYTTLVSPALLGMFKDPAAPPPVPVNFGVRITAIPYLPLDSLENRVMTLLPEGRI